MEGYTLLQQAIRYIEDHLLEDLNFETVAREVHMSGYEFHRAFRYLSGMTVTAYIRNRRLSLAGQELLETNTRVTDIALKYGYETPESFTKAFTRFHGTAPRNARQAGTPLKLFQPLVVKLIMEGGKTMDYRLEHTKAKEFIALVRSFPNSIASEPDNQDIADFWGEPETRVLVDRLRALRPIGKKDLFGLCSPKDADTFDYGIGVLVDSDTAHFDADVLLREGYSLWTVEPGTFVVLECLGETGDSIEKMWERFYKEFLPQMGYKAAQKTDFEVYLEKGRPGLFCELWIPVEK
ncbi:MAG: AraC family transcriptional regulator [Clostridia bacterium]|nr:AraC family transcriptional regulator [Clostridia bacterium]